MAGSGNSKSTQPKTYRLTVEPGNVAQSGRGLVGAYIPASKEGPAVLLLACDPHHDPGRPIEELVPEAMAYIHADLGSSVEVGPAGRPVWASIDNFGRFNEAIPVWPPEPETIPKVTFRRFPKGVNVDAFFAEGGPGAEAAVELLSSVIDAPSYVYESPSRNEFLGSVEAHSSLPAPGLIFRTVNLAAAEGDAKKIAQAVQLDPVLSASLINAANAARFAAAGKTASVPQAVIRLGSAFVSRLVFVAEMMARYRKGVCASFDYRGYWRNAIATGAAMRGLMNDFGLPVRDADDAFFAGLLSSIGWLAVAETFPLLMEVYLEKSQDADPITKARIQMEVFPCPIRLVAERYLERFSFPPHIAHAVAGRPGEAVEWYDCLAQAVRVAQALSPFACNAIPSTVAVPPACQEEWDRWRTLLPAA